MIGVLEHGCLSYTEVYPAAFACQRYPESGRSRRVADWIRYPPYSCHVTPATSINLVVISTISIIQRRTLLPSPNLVNASAFFRSMI